MMMISMDKKYRTRDGREVRIYAVDAGGSFPVHGAIKGEGVWITFSWMQEGFQMINEGPYDLIEVKPRIQRTVWLALYPNDVSWFSSKHFAHGDDCLACVKVEIDCEEGEGL